jgi:hypothetical protein
VVVHGLVEWVDRRVVFTDWGYMVGDHIYHHPYSQCVSSIHKCFKRVSISEIGIDSFEISCPVSMVTFFTVVEDWRDPNGIETKVLDILKLGCNSSEVSTAIVC